jgi:hypothetical protein
VAHIEAVPDPPSLVDLRSRPVAMMPRVDLPEIILEVMSWQPRLTDAFTDAFAAVSGGESRLSDLHVSVAAVLARAFPQRRLRADHLPGRARAHP